MASLISCEPSRRTPNSATASAPSAAPGLRPRSSISLLADQLKLSSLDERPPVKTGPNDEINAGLSKFPPPSGAFMLPCPIPVSRISEDLTTGVLVHPHDVFSSSVPHTCSPHCSRSNSDQEDENADPIPRPNDSREERSSLFQHSKRACRSLSASSSVHQHGNRPHHQVHKVNRTNCPTNQFEAHMSTLPRPIAIRPTPRYSEKSPGACSLNLAAVPLRPRPREINYLSRLSWHHPLFTSGIGAKAQHPSYGVHFACALPNCMTITTASCLPQQQQPQQQQQRVSGAEQRSAGATACTSNVNGRPMVGHQSLNVCHRHQSSLSLRTQAAHSCTESELSTSSGVASVCGHSSAFTPTHTGFGSPQNATQSSDCSLSPDIDSASSSVQFPVPTPSSGFHESSFPWLSEAFSLPDCSRDMEALTMEEKTKKRKTKRENFPFLASSVTNEYECSPNDNSLANKFQSELTDCAIRCRSQPNGVTQPEEEEDEEEEEGEVVDSSNPRTRCPPRISSGNFLTGLKRRRGSGNGEAVPTSLTSSVATSPAYRWQSGGNPSGFRTSFPQVDNTQYDFGSSLPQDRINSNQFTDVFFFGSGSGLKSGSDLAGDDDLSSLAQITLMSGENKSAAIPGQPEMGYCPCAVCESASIRIRSGPTDLVGTVPPTSTDGLSDVQYWHSLVAHSMNNPRVGLDSDGIPCRHVCAQLGDLCESMEEEKDYETPETMTEEAGSVSDSSWKRSNHPVIKSPSVHDITFAPIHSQPDESEASDLERDENDGRRLNSTDRKSVDSTNSHNPTAELQNSTSCVRQEGDEQQLVLFSSSESEDSDPDAIVSPQLVNRHISDTSANANNGFIEQTNSSRPDIDLDLIEND